MTRKAFRFLFAASFCSLIISGCGANQVIAPSSEVPHETSEETISLRVWGAEEDAALLAQTIANFEAAYPDTSFNFTVEPMPESSCKDNLLADVLNAPDVFTFADDQLATLAASGVLEPVANPDDIIARNSESSVSAACVNDTLYAYPLTADNGYFMFYNKEYFSETDLQTLDSMLAIAATNGKKVTFDLSSGWYLYSFFGNTGLSVGLNENGISNFCDWNSTAGPIKGVDVANALLDITANPGFLNGGDSILTEGASDGTVIAGVSGVWSATAIQEAWGDNYGAVKLPTYTCAGQQVQMSSYAGYKMVGVNSYSQNFEWASTFADFMTNEESQTLRFKLRAQGPANSNAAASPEVAASFAIQALINQSEHASLQRIGAAYWGPTSDFGLLLSNHNSAGQDLQEVLDKLVADITASNS